MKTEISFNWEDAGQVMTGAFALAVPISFSEEAWRLGENITSDESCCIAVCIADFSLYLHISERVSRQCEATVVWILSQNSYRLWLGKFGSGHHTFLFEQISNT